jgi:hypothetical protein
MFFSSTRMILLECHESPAAIACNVLPHSSNETYENSMHENSVACFGWPDNKINVNNFQINLHRLWRIVCTHNIIPNVFFSAEISSMVRPIILIRKSVVRWKHHNAVRGMILTLINYIYIHMHRFIVSLGTWVNVSSINILHAHYVPVVRCR